MKDCIDLQIWTGIKRNLPDASFNRVERALYRMRRVTDACCYNEIYSTLDLKGLIDKQILALIRSTREKLAKLRAKYPNPPED